jgi:hypothetical protein
MGALGDYLVSLPERVLRSATALAGGLLRELGGVAVPAAVRRTRLYRSLVDSTLRFLVEQVGQVEGVYPREGRLAEDFAIRRAAGNGLELIGVLTFRASPVWVLAALADVTGTGRRVIQEIAGALKQEGLLEPETRFDTVDQILDGLERSAGRAAEAINTPPLNVAELRQEWAELRHEVASISRPQLPSPELVTGLWDRLKAQAAQQGRPVFQVSALMALSAVTSLPEGVRWLARSAHVAARRTGELFAGALLGHYSRALEEIRAEGFMPYWSRQFRPYLQAAAAQFSPGRTSLTQRWLRGRRGGAGS